MNVYGKGFVSGFSLRSWARSDFTWKKSEAGDSSAVRLDVSAVPSHREGLEDSWRVPGLHPCWKAEETRLYSQWRLAAVAAARCQQSRWTDQHSLKEDRQKAEAWLSQTFFFFQLSQGQIVHAYNVSFCFNWTVHYRCAWMSACWFHIQSSWPTKMDHHTLQQSVWNGIQ